MGPQNDYFLKPITDALYRPEWITAFLSRFREKYGSAEAYLKNEVGLSDGDIEKIRSNLLVPRPIPN